MKVHFLGTHFLLPWIVGTFPFYITCSRFSSLTINGCYSFKANHVSIQGGEMLVAWRELVLYYQRTEERNMRGRWVRKV